MTRTRSLVSAAVLFATLGASLVMAGRDDVTISRRAGARAPVRRVIERLTKDPEIQRRLDLTTEQISRLREISSSARSQMTQMRESLRTQRRALRSALADLRSDRSEIEKAAGALAKASQDLRQEGLRVLLDTRDVLSPEQRQTLRSLIRGKLSSLREGRHLRGRHGRLGSDRNEGSTSQSDEDSASPHDEDGHDNENNF